MSPLTAPRGGGFAASDSAGACERNNFNFASERLVPRQRKTDRAFDDAHHAVGLHEVAPGLARGDIEVLGEQPVMVAACEQRIEHRAVSYTHLRAHETGR